MGSSERILFLITGGNIYSVFKSALEDYEEMNLF